MSNTTDNIDVLKIDDTIRMLNTYAKEPNLEPLISILGALREDVSNESLLAQLTDTWRNLGIYQGTVLTYVPYFYTLVADDIFGDNLK